MSTNDQVKSYKTNFITNAIFKVDFPEIDLDTSDIPNKLQNTLKNKFPTVHKLKTGNLDVKVKGVDQVTTQLNEKILLEFKNRNNKDKFNKVIISPNYVSLEYESYNCFKEFYKDIKFVFDAFLEAYPIEKIKRIGLRYINQITLDSGNPFDWDNLINKNLLYVHKFAENSKDIDILRSMHILELEEDDHQLRFQFGLYNSEYPNPIARREFVLDYDCYIDNEMESFKLFEDSKRCNAIIYKWFEKSIGENLREIMRGSKK